MLLLDEPTNDLDVDTLRALEDALLDFAGCAVVITHDRWFLDRVATHILAFEGDSQTTWFEGTWGEYAEWVTETRGAEALEPHRIKYKPLACRKLRAGRGDQSAERSAREHEQARGAERGTSRSPRGAGLRPSVEPSADRRARLRRQISRGRTCLPCGRRSRAASSGRARGRAGRIRRRHRRSAAAPKPAGKPRIVVLPVVPSATV